MLEKRKIWYFCCKDPISLSTSRSKGGDSTIRYSGELKSLMCLNLLRFLLFEN